MTADDEQDDPHSSDPKFITALARGLAVLHAFRPNDGTLGNQTLSSRTGLPKATVSRLTYTLCKLGYLSQQADSGEYRLTTGVLTLGLGALAQADLEHRAQLEMKELCRSDNANVTAGLGERHGISIVYLSTHRKPSSVGLSFALGGEVPLFATSIGRACLMGMSTDRQDELLDRAMRSERTRDKDRLVGWLDKARSDFDRYGFCTSFGDWRAEINGIAAPVRLYNENRDLALNVGGLSFFNPPDELIEQHGERLRQAAANLSLRPLGHDR